MTEIKMAAALQKGEHKMGKDLMNAVEQVVGAANDAMWGTILIAVLIGLGLWFTIRTDFVQFRNFKEMIRLIFDKRMVSAEGKKEHRRSRRLPSVRRRGSERGTWPVSLQPWLSAAPGQFLDVADCDARFGHSICGKYAGPSV